MADIYKYAQRVVVWLGLPSPNSSLALRVLDHLGSQLEVTKSSMPVPAQGLTETEWFESGRATAIDNDPNTWHAIFDLLNRSYFHRVWIFQEIQLASSSALIQCGTETVSWRQLRRAIGACGAMTLPTEVPLQLRTRLDSLWSLSMDSRSMDPMRLFEYAIAAECSNPRDRVYAILGLLPEVLSRKIQPHYASPTREVHRKAMMAYTQVTGELHVLGLVGPSWMPDWTAPRALLLNVLNVSCSGNTDAEALCIAPDVLRVNGVLFDIIDEIRELQAFDDAEVRATIREFWLSGSKPYPSGQSVVEASAWTLWLGILTEKWSTSASSSLAEVRPHLQELKDHGACSIDALLTLENISNYNIFRTKKGYHGISPAGIAPGDNVYVVSGCDSAVILRNQPNEKHLFIGCAHIHGIMDGEALLGPLPEDYMLVIGDPEAVPAERFRHRATGELTMHDPRLQSLAEDWRHVRTPHRCGPPRWWMLFRTRLQEKYHIRILA
jgi:hypothetical protein